MSNTANVREPKIGVGNLRVSGDTSKTNSEEVFLDESSPVTEIFSMKNTDTMQDITVGVTGNDNKDLSRKKADEVVIKTNGDGNFTGGECGSLSEKDDSLHDYGLMEKAPYEAKAEKRKTECTKILKADNDKLVSTVRSVCEDLISGKMKMSLAFIQIQEAVGYVEPLFDILSSFVKGDESFDHVLLEIEWAVGLLSFSTDSNVLCLDRERISSTSGLVEEVLHDMDEHRSSYIPIDPFPVEKYHMLCTSLGVRNEVYDTVCKVE